MLSTGVGGVGSSAPAGRSRHLRLQQRIFVNVQSYLLLCIVQLALESPEN
jgi:hypothetical protein